jgi:hypothetical protein
MDYPYFSPIVLTDALFVAYGGFTGSSTAFQRSAAYLAAEMQATDAIGTFLKPTIITGTYPWPFTGKALVLPFHHILGIYSVVPLSPVCYANCDLLSGEGCSFQVDDGGWGYVWLRNVTYVYGKCCTQAVTPMSVQLSYVAGLTSGTSYLPTTLMGLTQVAQIFLNEMIDKGANEGGGGDPGVISFSTAGHMEVRKQLANTVMGNSAAANFANRMFKRMRPNRALKLGW